MIPFFMFVIGGFVLGIAVLGAIGSAWFNWMIRRRRTNRRYI